MIVVRCRVKREDGACTIAVTIHCLGYRPAMASGLPYDEDQGELSVDCPGRIELVPMDVWLGMLTTMTERRLK